MHYLNAMNLVRWKTRDDLRVYPFAPKVRFVSPAVSAILAAAAMSNGAVRTIEFDNSDCAHYAEITGLAAALRGEDHQRQDGALQGKTYSPLTKLATHAEVDCCNEIIANVLYQHLTGVANKGFVNDVVKVVGELHDNVASHSNGMGFSAAQVYRSGQSARLEFAIADNGKGMLRNVLHVDSLVATHADAIAWCLKRGNTTARRQLTGMEQRLPEDWVVSPLPAGVTGFSSDNHHAGEGLWKLTELVRRCQGALWLWSGDAEFAIGRDGKIKRRTSDINWDGVAIEIELDINRAQAIGTAADAGASRRDALAERLGI